MARKKDGGRRENKKRWWKERKGKGKELESGNR